MSPLILMLRERFAMLAEPAAEEEVAELWLSYPMSLTEPNSEIWSC